MANEKEETVRLVRQRSKQAVALAMEGRWQEAITANKAIIDSYPSDIDAYNRLGRAYTELGEYSLAREAYSRAKELDPYNAIAEKNLRRLSHLKDGEPMSEEGFQQVEPQVFIEETGKAGVVKLVQLAPKEVLARVDAGDNVHLRIQGSEIIAESSRHEYLGLVEPRHSQRLIKLMQGGNRYSATVISSSEDNLAVIIREVYQHPSQAGQLSFPSRGFEGLKPYVSDRLLRHQLEYEEESAEEPGFGTAEDEIVEMSPLEITEEEEEELGG
jgi:tetratricopeptide (TPR) repeat protein